MDKVTSSRAKARQGIAMDCVALWEAFPTEFRFFLNRYFGDWQRYDLTDLRLLCPGNFVPKTMNISGAARNLLTYFRRA
jgi:hypothetical protein